MTAYLRALLVTMDQLLVAQRSTSESLAAANTKDSYRIVVSQAVVDELLLALDDDWVMFVELLTTTSMASDKRDAPTYSEATVEEAFELANVLLTNGHAQVGTVESGRGFVPWTTNLESSLARIRNEWNALRRPVEMGDVCWFQATPINS